MGTIIEIYKIQESDALLKKMLKHCWGVDSKMSKTKFFACNDSILEVPEYWCFCHAPRSVAMQLRTHEKKHRMYFWMGTARPDRADAIPGEYSREQLVPFAMVLTARAIKEISHYRMCKKAEAPTRDFMAQFKRTLNSVEPELAKQMMPLCKYRGGICTEFNSCGMNKKEKDAEQ